VRTSYRHDDHARGNRREHVEDRQRTISVGLDKQLREQTQEFLPEAALATLLKPNPAVISTVTSKGRPVSVATWYLTGDDGLLMLCLNADRARLKHLEVPDELERALLTGREAGPHEIGVPET
jgi:hypothetical protein